MNEQAELVRSWLGSGFQLENRDGRHAFEDLDEADLFVVAGLHFTDMVNPKWRHPMDYIPMTDADMDAFRRYIASGRPCMGFHGGVASYDDRPEFGHLLGVYWNWRTTAHTPVGVWPMKPTDPDSPLTGGVGEFETNDEIYYNLQIAPCVRELKNHLTGYYHKMKTPLLLTCEGGRVDGSGKVGYFGLGHSMGSMEAPEVKTLFINTVNWLLE